MWTIAAIAIYKVPTWLSSLRIASLIQFRQPITNMEKITTFEFDPVKTPGIIHADNLTKESAEAVAEVLQDNNAKYHIFQTTEDEMGVRF